MTNRKLVFSIQTLPGERKWVVENLTIREDGAVQIKLVPAPVLSTGKASAGTASPEAQALELASTWIASRFKQWSGAL